MLVGTREHIQPPQDKFQITEWSSADQVSWTYLGPVLTTEEMPSDLRGDVYGPTIQEIAPGLWRMVFTADNLMNVLRQNSFTAVLAAGMTLTILTAGIDLSVGAVVGLSGVLCADRLAHGTVPGRVETSRGAVAALSA